MPTNRRFLQKYAEHNDKTRTQSTTIYNQKHYHISMFYPIFPVASAEGISHTESPNVESSVQIPNRLHMLGLSCGGLMTQLHKSLGCDVLFKARQLGAPENNETRACTGVNYSLKGGSMPPLQHHFGLERMPPRASMVATSRKNTQHPKPSKTTRHRTSFVY